MFKNQLVFTKNLTFVFVLFLFSSTITAQNSPSVVSIEEEENLVIINNNDQSLLIPSDVDKNKYYIDLELLNGNLSDLNILKESEVIWSSSLAEVPKSALYELDLSEMNKGSYILQIRTFKEDIKKEIVIQ